jgi:hypothetical protein
MIDKIICNVNCLFRTGDPYTNMHEETVSFALLVFLGKCIVLRSSCQFPSLILYYVKGSEFINSSRANQFYLIGVSCCANP